MARELWIVGREADESLSVPADARVVCQDLLRSRELRAEGHEVEIWDEQFPYEDLARHSEQLTDLRKNWASRVGSGELASLLEFEGIRLTELLEYGITYVLVDILRSLAIVEELFRERPTRVVASGLSTAESSVLGRRCQADSIPAEGVATEPAAATRPGKRRNIHPLHALSRWYRMRRQLSRFRHRSAPLRILYRENAYSQAVVKTHRKRLAAMAYRRGGKQLKSFLKVASMLSSSFRARRRSAIEGLEKIRETYRTMDDARLVLDGVDIWPYLKTHIDTVILGSEDDWKFANPFAAGKTRTLEELFDYILYAGFHLDESKPEAVVVSQDSWDLDKVMVACARVRGIGTASLQHGVPGVYYPLYADRFMAWGDTCAEFYQQHGEPGERFVVTGRPRRDYLAHERAEAHPVSRRELGVPDGARLVLYIGQPSTGLNIGDTPMHWQLQLEALFEGTKDLEDTWVVIRPHPTEDASEYDRIRDHYGHERCVLSSRQDLLALIDAVDVVILRDSTVSLDTIQLEKPIVVLDRYYYPIDLPFDLDGFPIVRQPDELGPAIDRVANCPPVDPENSRFLQAQVAQDGARACQAIYDAVMELSEQSTTETDAWY